MLVVFRSEPVGGINVADKNIVHLLLHLNSRNRDRRELHQKLLEIAVNNGFVGR
jgi:hypothetical protein